MASTQVGDCPVLFHDSVLGVPPKSNKKLATSKKKLATTTPRKRKSAMKDFKMMEDYKRFAKSRNAATKRCRQKKEEELKILREENPALKEENARLRKAVDTQKEKKKPNGSDSAATMIVMAENAALKSRVSDLERELEEALCKLKLGSVGGGAKVVTLALRSEGEGKKDLVKQAMDTLLGDLYDNQFDNLVLEKEDDDKTVDEIDISIIPSVPYMPELDSFPPGQLVLFQLDPNVMWGSS